MMFLTRIFTSIGVLVVLFVIAGLIVTQLTKPDVPDKTILEIDFTRTLVEYVPDDPFAGLALARTGTVREVVDALTQAAEDKRVVMLIARMGTAGMGLAQIQEVRDAILAFRSTGKSAVAYADTFGEFGPGNAAYYLATAFEEIHLQPSGDVGLTGLIAESPFISGTLEKLGIVPRFDQRREYKNAMNVFTERRYTQPHREAVQHIMQSQFAQLVRGIATTRQLSEAEVRALIDRGPFLGQQAVEAQLVDGLRYWDETVAAIKEKIGADAEWLSIRHYLERAGRPHAEGETIALIYGVGGVQRGKGGYNPIFGSPAMGADTITAAFRSAINDEKVKAILFRVDSPGGSYVASDTIWRETVRAKEAGKPVIVSMGNVAGSGGYFVAMAAHKIVAQPGTITGSIGVLAGKMLTTELWRKLGLSWDEVHTSDNATMWSSIHDYTPAQWAQFQSWLDTVYDDFISKVAQGRSLPKETVLEIAKGRIWTGEDAKALGLVDELGGLSVALRLAKQAAKITDETEVQLKLFPAKKTLLEAIAARFFGQEEDSAEEGVAAAWTGAVDKLQPLARLAREIGLNPPPGVLSMPEWNMTP